MPHKHKTHHRIHSLIHLKGIHGTRRRRTDGSTSSSSNSNNNNENVFNEKSKKCEKKRKEGRKEDRTSVHARCDNENNDIESRKRRDDKTDRVEVPESLFFSGFLAPLVWCRVCIRSALNLLTDRMPYYGWNCLSCDCFRMRNQMKSI